MKTKEPKYRVGQTVYFTNGPLGEVECVVVEVVTGYQGVTTFIPYSQPVYWVRWPDGFKRTAGERDLSAESRAASVGR
jgi:hypothetical protein